MRLVNNTEWVNIGGEDYTPCGLSFNPPSASGNDGKITIDDTDGRLTYILQSVEHIEAEVSIIDAENPDEPLDGPVSFDVESFTTSSEGSCNLVLTARSRLSYGLSKFTYSSQLFPGLFG